MSSQNWNDINSPGVFVPRSSQKKPEPPREETHLTDEPVQKKSSVNVRVLRAQFISDKETDFNKKCKVRIEVDGPESLSVTYTLWAKYNGEEYDLHKEEKGRIKNGVVEGQLPLYFVDDFYNDYFVNAQTAASVEYFVKVQFNGASEFTGEPMTMPLKQRGCTIKFMRQIDGQDGPAANLRCVIEIDKTTFEKTTSDEGIVDFPLSKNAQSGSVTVYVDTEHKVNYPLHIGKLAHHETIKGMAQRLRHLGILHGDHEKENDTVFKIALKAFQAKNGLQVTGKINDETKAKFEEC
jgi:hypothetical protein